MVSTATVPVVTAWIHRRHVTVKLARAVPVNQGGRGNFVKLVSVRLAS